MTVMLLLFIGGQSALSLALIATVLLQIRKGMLMMHRDLLMPGPPPVGGSDSRP